MQKAPSLKVPKALGEKSIRLARKFCILDPELKVERVQDYVCIPLLNKPTSTEIKEFREHLSEFEISMRSFSERKMRTPKLIEALKEKFPNHLLPRVSNTIDFIGDIAVVEIPTRLEDHKRIIGESILKTYKRTKTVLAKSSAIEGVYRLRKFEVIAGIEKTTTTHREFGCIYHIDLSKTYFSPRLSFEHDRVASQVEEDETVIDMFAGVGPFSILIAKRREKVRTYAIDVNPGALEFLKKNVVSNHVEEKVIPILGDVRKIVRSKSLVGVADRAIMNLPKKSTEYVNSACKAIKLEGGIIHYYEFSKAPEPLENSRIRLIKAVNEANRQVKRILSKRLVRATAPFTWQVVVDVRIQ